jgi:hypothetical protein
MTRIPVARLQRLVDETILDALAPLGFTKDETGGSFAESKDVYSYVAGLTQYFGGSNRIMPFVQVGYATVGQIKSHFLSPGQPVQKVIGHVQRNYRDFIRDRDAYIGCETDEELPVALCTVRDFTLGRIVPCLKIYSDPRAALRSYLDYDENNKGLQDTTGAYSWTTALTGLTLARLYGPEHYQILKHRYRFFFIPLRLEFKERATKLIAYLDQDPLPALTQICDARPILR